MQEDIIYSLIQSALFHPDSQISYKSSPPDWEAVYQELTEQTINGIPADWLINCVQLPPSLQRKWEKQRIQQIGCFYQLLYEQNELIQLMKASHIPMAILKGIAAAIYYPDPSVRTMGDIDFLVPEDEYGHASQVMASHGYHEKYDEHHVDYHITMEKNGFVFELHRRLAGMPEGEAGTYLQQVIAKKMDSLDMIRIDEYEVPVLPDLENGIVLLLHIVKHLKNGLGLRQIIDWMMYVDKKLHDDVWYSKMQPLLQKTKYEKLAKSVTRMCQLYLGLEQENITWCVDISESVCTKLMDYIMEQGNFGRKVFEEDKGIKIVGEFHNPIQFFKFLQKRGEKNWMLLRKYPIFRLLAWLYMICRYICKGIQRKTPLKELMLDVSNGKDRRDLFKQLEIYQE